MDKIVPWTLCADASCGELAISLAFPAVGCGRVQLKLVLHVNLMIVIDLDGGGGPESLS